jgi:7-cyano-7-deazaguanine tRNA-ribosyltransferase
MYPFAQSVFPEITDRETEDEVTKKFEEITKKTNLIPWKGDKTLEEISQSKNKLFDLDSLRISAVANMQFGLGSSEALLVKKLEIKKSKKTGKIRNIYADGKHVLSMRANDGMFTLKIDGARLLHKFFRYPTLRVIVKKDAVPFIRDGKSVFAKFVEDCDPTLRPFDECIVVDEKDNFLAVGRCLLNRLEMLSFNYGMAVKIR